MAARLAENLGSGGNSDRRARNAPPARPAAPAPVAASIQRRVQPGHLPTLVSALPGQQKDKTQ